MTVSAAVPPNAHNSFSRLPCNHTTGLGRQRIFSGKTKRSVSVSRASLPQPFRVAIIGRRFSGILFEDAIELRKRLKSDRERDFADAKIDIFQKFASLFEPRLCDVIDELDPGHLLKLFAQMCWIDSGYRCDPAQRQRFVGVFFNKLPGPPDVSRFGAMAVWRERSESGETSFRCVF